MNIKHQSLNNNDRFSDLISVVVPIYNVEKTLARCLDSILGQTYKNLEIILVDDGSTDHSGEIAEKYGKKDKRIKVIHTQNGGLSSARNVGIKAATGKFIGFIDSDDWIDKDMYKTLYETIIENKIDIAVAKFVMVFKKKFDFAKNKKTNVLNFPKNIEMLYHSTYGDYAWNKLYKASLFQDINYPKGLYFEDKYTTFKLYEKAGKIAFIDKSLYYYVQQKNSIMHKNFDFKKMSDNINSFITKIDKPYFIQLDLFWNSFLDSIITYKCRALFIRNSDEKSRIIDYLDDCINEYFKKDIIPEDIYIKSQTALKNCKVFWPKVKCKDLVRKLLLL